MTAPPKQTASPPRFVYFDLGNVLLKADNERIASQVAAATGVPVETIERFLRRNNLQEKIETGKVTVQEAYDSFCDQTGTRPDLSELKHAASAIFEVNVPVLPLIGQLVAANYRLGILSNTSAPHWEYVAGGRYAMIPGYFQTIALSFQIGVMKPDRRIYEVAAELAGVPPQEIFFTDDLAENVEAARAAGWDAVQFESALQLGRELHQRGVRFNY